MPPARYTLDGVARADGRRRAVAELPDRRLRDVALGARRASRRPAARRTLRDTVELVGPLPAGDAGRSSRYSCWEELDGGEHASTLGAVGRRPRRRRPPPRRRGLGATQAARVRAALRERFRHGDRLGRGPDDERVDASLLWLGVPFGVLPLDDPLLAADRRRGASRPPPARRRPLPLPRRHVLRRRRVAPSRLLARLARARAAATRRAAEPLRAWVRAQARPNGDLPEQVTGHAQDAGDGRAVGRAVGAGRHAAAVVARHVPDRRNGGAGDASCFRRRRRSRPASRSRSSCAASPRPRPVSLWHLDRARRRGRGRRRRGERRRSGPARGRLRRRGRVGARPRSTCSPTRSAGRATASSPTTRPAARRRASPRTSAAST